MVSLKYALCCIITSMKKMPVPEKIKEVSSIFARNGYSLYVVGGAVRDYLLRINNNDWDFCTDARPEQVMSMFRFVVPTGIKHGTVTVHYKGSEYEITTFRTEGAYSDRRHPDSVNFVSDLREDLSRRDFTVNAFAADCRDGVIIDLFDGISDLKKGLIRAIGNPEERFNEDALRLLRLCRFCSKLGFTPEEKTFEYAKRLAPSISFVSKERICDEISKILMTKVPSRGLRLMYETGLMNELVPLLAKCAEVEQDKAGSDNVLDHIFNAVDAAASYGYSLTVRWTMLLHDIGKPLCMKKVGNFTRFFGHELKGEEAALKIMKELRFSNAMQEDICVLIRNHMLKYKEDWTDGAVKRLVNRVGLQRMDMLFEVLWCDQIASDGRVHLEETDRLKERIESVLDQPMTLKDLAVDGKDLMAIGIPKGPQMGRILDKLLEMVIDYPTLNEKETLLKQAKSLLDAE